MRQLIFWGLWVGAWVVGASLAEQTGSTASVVLPAQIMDVAQCRIPHALIAAFHDRNLNGFWAEEVETKESRTREKSFSTVSVCCFCRKRTIVAPKFAQRCISVSHWRVPLYVAFHAWKSHLG